MYCVRVRACLCVPVWPVCACVHVLVVVCQWLCWFSWMSLATVRVFPRSCPVGEPRVSFLSSKALERPHTGLRRESWERRWALRTVPWGPEAGLPMSCLALTSEGPEGSGSGLGHGRQSPPRPDPPPRLCPLSLLHALGALASAQHRFCPRPLLAGHSSSRPPAVHLTDHLCERPPLPSTRPVQGEGCRPRPSELLCGAAEA